MGNHGSSKDTVIHSVYSVYLRVPSCALCLCDLKFHNTLHLNGNHQTTAPQITSINPAHHLKAAIQIQFTRIICGNK